MSGVFVMSEWLIVDANVIVKAFVAEAESEAAGRLWSSDVLLAAPAHALAEVGEVLRRKQMQKQISPDQWREASLVLPGSILSIGLAEIFELAMTASLELAQSFYDALYLAAADRWDCLFVTADKRLLIAVEDTRWQARVQGLLAYDAVRAR